jgi:uncharacterized damage-inducible protein DinB
MLRRLSVKISLSALTRMSQVPKEPDSRTPCLNFRNQDAPSFLFGCCPVYSAGRRKSFISRCHIHQPEGELMRKFIFAILFVFICTAPAMAQAPPASARDPLSSWLRNAYMGGRNNILKSAEKVPEDLYILRPGAQPEVRTFGRILGHVANFNYLWCSQAKGEKNPAHDTDFEKVESKAGLVKALNDAFSYCDVVYAGLTDSSATEIVQITQENGREARVPRISLLIQNYGHNSEHYGNLVTYMRIKGIVPPSSEPRSR